MARAKAVGGQKVEIMCRYGRVDDDGAAWLRGAGIYDLICYAQRDALRYVEREMEAILKMCRTRKTDDNDLQPQRHLAA